MIRYVERKNAILFLISLFILLIGIFAKSNIIFIFLVSMISLNVIYGCLMNRRYIFMAFVGFTYEELIVMYFLNKIIKLKETSWRIQYSSSNNVDVAFNLIAISLMIFCSIYYITCGHLGWKKAASFTAGKSVFQMNRFFLWGLIAASLIFMVVYIRFSGVFALRNYSRGANSQVIALYRILRTIYLYIFFYLKPAHRSILRIVLSIVAFLFIGFDILAGVIGYRFILVELVFLLFFMNFEKVRKLKIKNLIIIGFIAGLVYIGLSIIRNPLGGSTNLLDSFFRHERNIFYGFVAIIDNTNGVNLVNTYMNSLLSLFPTFIDVIDQNTGQILLPYIRGNAVFAEGVTMGAFFLSEAYFNYKTIGIVLTSVFFGFIAVFLEKKKVVHRFKYNNMIYYFILSQIYSIIYYGSSNYLNMITYFIILVYLYSIVEKALNKHNSLV